MGLISRNPIALSSLYTMSEGNSPAMILQKMQSLSLLIYLTPFIPLSYQGEGEGLWRGASPLLNSLFTWAYRLLSIYL